MSITATLRTAFCMLSLLVATTHGSHRLQAAEPAEIFNVWPASPPGPERELGPEQNTSGPNSRTVAGKPVIRIGNVATPQAYVYLPKPEQRSDCAVIICPGGGYNILAWDLEGTEVAEWLNSIGVTAIVLKYRVPTGQLKPKWQLPVQDAQRTLSLVRSRADEWGLSAERIGILGFSAGGDTAARTALATQRHYDPVDAADEQSCHPNAAILVYPAYLANEDKTGLREELEVTKDAPVTFLVHAFDDNVPVQNSLFLALALKQASVPVELHVYDTGGHGYGLRPVDAHPVTSWPQRCEAWLKRNSWLKN